MMLASLRRILRSRRSIAWLCALALWLPAAQWAAVTHALLHLHAVSQERDSPAHLPTSCDICVVAAAIGGAAPLPDAVLPQPTQDRYALPQTALLVASGTPPLIGYRSRAPPFPHA